MNYQDQLKRQLSFINRSCIEYDRGNKDEALRIAVSLRVIFHDTNFSKSLLHLIGVKNKIKIISTIGSGKLHDYYKDKFILDIPVMLSPKGVKPILGGGKRKEFFLADYWWNEVIMVQQHSYSRKDVILSAANQDGGAHVDSNPSEKTKELKDGIEIRYERRDHKNHLCLYLDL